MAFTIHYEGHQIPSIYGGADDAPKAELDKVLASIAALPLGPADREAMWGLWSCVDALVLDNEDLYSDPEMALEAVLDDIENPEFRHAVRTDETAFEDVIIFVRAHWDLLRLTVSL
jgi:hypothetical protein